MENNNEMNTELDTTNTATATESQDGQSIEATSDAEGESLDAEADKTPAWVEFCGALTAHAVAIGLAVQDQKSFTKFVNAETGHKLYVAKQGRQVKRVDTTLPILGQDGTYALVKPNGKIECHVLPELETVTGVLTQLADSSIGKIRSAKRAPKAADVSEPATETAAE